MQFDSPSEAANALDEMGADLDIDLPQEYWRALSAVIRHLQDLESDDAPAGTGDIWFERDQAVQQLEVQQANLKIIKLALEENRPLEALRQVNDALDELQDTIEWHEEMEQAREADAAEAGDDL